jgi:hypothetical protein
MREDRSKSEEGEGREEEEEDDDDMAAEEDEMAAMLGFGGFGSTKVSEGFLLGRRRVAKGAEVAGLPLYRTKK